MRIRARTAVGRLASQRGVTLIELVFAMALAIIVIGAPLTFMIVSLHQHNTVISRTDAVRDAEVGLDRMMRDLRQADPTQSVSLTWGSDSASAVFYIPKPGTVGASDEKVTWTCTAGASCTRQIDTGPVTSQIKYVTSASFAPKDANGNTLSSGSSTTPAYVGITLTMQGVSQDGVKKQVAAKGITTPITLSAGVDLWGNT